MIERTPYLALWDELAPHRQMVFISGPRQAGKTTLTEQIRSRSVQSRYLNWDEPEHRRRLLTEIPDLFTGTGNPTGR